MTYKGYKLTEDGNRLLIEVVSSFNPIHVFECGQCFRWIRLEDGSYTGIAGGRVVNLKMQDKLMILTGCTADDFRDFWYDYLDLGRDYDQIKLELMKKDSIMEKAVEFGWGIRLLKQDLWEALISFIISANNRIPRIMKIVETLSCMYGRQIGEYYAFPDMDSLADAELENLQACRGGFRCRYISETAKMVRNGVVRLDGLRDMKTADARSTLTQLPGVGDKVADCTLLFSGIKHDVFPADVWVKRVMEELYFKKEASLKDIQKFASDYFGELAGFAQQYLFYYARENRIGTG